MVPERYLEKGKNLINFEKSILDSATGGLVSGAHLSELIPITIQCHIPLRNITCHIPKTPTM